MKFKRHSKRSKLTHTDIDLALRLRNMQVQVIATTVHLVNNR